MTKHSKPMICITVVIPVFNEESVLPAMLDRLHGIQSCSSKFLYQLLFIDDGSTDKTRSILELAYLKGECHFLSFSRNFGHQAAVSAGLDYAEGDYIAIIDGDLQDPPEAIPEMVDLLIKTAADVAYGVRISRKETAFKRLSYWLFYRILSVLTPINIPLDSGDFSVVTKRVAKSINDMPERHRFVRGLRSYAGFKQVPFYYSRDSRAAGKPKYTFNKLLALAADGIFTFSEIPLKLSTYLGLIISILSFLLGSSFLFWRILSGNVLPGFATLSVALFFLGGVQLLCLGILGEYVGRIHSEVKRRPTYVVERFFGPAT